MRSKKCIYKISYQVYLHYSKEAEMQYLILGLTQCTAMY